MLISLSPPPPVPSPWIGLKNRAGFNAGEEGIKKSRVGLLKKEESLGDYSTTSLSPSSPESLGGGRGQWVSSSKSDSKTGKVLIVVMVIVAVVVVRVILILAILNSSNSSNSNSTSSKNDTNTSKL